jgi:hypothetical protein
MPTKVKRTGPEDKPAASGTSTADDSTGADRRIPSTLTPPPAARVDGPLGRSALFGRVLVSGNIQSHAMPAFPDGLLSAFRTGMAGRLVTDRDTGQVRTWFHVERQAVGALRLIRGNDRQWATAKDPR